MNQVANRNSVRASKPLVMNGLYPATVTPFAEDLSIDYAALERHLVETAAANGVKGIVVNGGVAELLQLSAEEQTRIVEMANGLRRDGQIVIAGVAGDSAAEVTERGLAAKSAGADALLVLPPFDRRAYRRLAAERDCVVAFFTELNDRIGLPLIVFQYPPQSGVAYPLAILKELAKLHFVVAVKAATATADIYRDLWDELNEDVSVLAAVDSPPLLEMLMHGAHGALIGISSVAPEGWSRLLDVVNTGDEVAAREYFRRFCEPLMESIFENQQPTRATSEAASMKEALVQLGQIPSSRVRPLAVDVDDVVREDIRKSLKMAGLLDN